LEGRTVQKRDNVQFGFSLDSAASTEIASTARRIEECGYQFLSCGEHLYRGPGRPGHHWILTTLAIAAGSTQQLRLVASAVIAPLRNPAILAKETAFLDAASGGRLVLGVGIGGDFPEEFHALGIPVKERGSRTDEILQLLRRLWTEERVVHHGRHYTIDDLTILPRPAQQPHPPIWIGGRLEAAMVRALRYGNAWYPYMYSPRRYRESVARVTELAAEMGRDLTNFDWGISLHTCVHPSSEEAMRLGTEWISARYHIPEDPKGLFRGAALVGSPQEIAARVQEYLDAGVRYFNFLCACPADYVPRNLELVTEQVVGALRRKP
jgi:probable F420-dependent oxidoreductase